MATDFDKPINLDIYLTVWDFVRDNIDLVSTWFDEAETPGVNIPTNAKRFSATNKRFEYWSGAAWFELLLKATTAYDIRAAVADLADLATSATTAGACTGNSATASLATNSLQLGGVVASSYTLNSDIRAIAFGGTAANTVAGARTNLAVYSKTEGDARYALESNNLSDLTNAVTARNNLGMSEATLDARYLLESNNLSDLVNDAMARSNLDVYSKGEVNGFFLEETQNLADLVDKPTARTNLDVYSKAYIDASTFTTTTPSVPVGSTAYSAPSGYKFSFMNTTISFTSGSVVVTAINATGTSVTVSNTTSAAYAQLIIWSKVG